MHENTGQLGSHDVSSEVAGWTSQAGPSRALCESPAPLPPILDPSHLQSLFARLANEHQPEGPTENAIVRDLARQAAATELWGQSAEATFRQAAVALPNLFARVERVTALDENDFDQVLSAAAAAESSERTARQHLGHSRAFYRALQMLREQQAARRSRAQLARLEPPPAFPSESACQNYLAARFAHREWTCPRCVARKGYFLAERRVWECASCKAQVGLRSGTLMAGSQVSLMRWFEAIRLMLWEPTIAAARLAELISMPRIATVRKMAAKIRTAMADERATQQLAGLDRHFARTKASLSQAPRAAKKFTPLAQVHGGAARMAQTASP